MSTQSQLEVILSGDLRSLYSTDGELQDRDQVQAALAKSRPYEMDALGDLVQRLATTGEPLQALAVLKAAQSDGVDSQWLCMLLGRMLFIDATESGAELATSSQVLGSHDPVAAWDRLSYGTLDLRATPVSTATDEWIVCDDGAAALVLRLPLDPRSAEERDHVLSIAERRHDLRYGQHLVATCRFYGTDGAATPPASFRGELFDLSAEGAGIRVDTRYGTVDPDTVLGLPIRLEVPPPDGGAPISLDGTVRWCKPERAMRKRVIRVGVQFNSPDSAEARAMANLVTQGKGDQLFLWNLWEAYSQSR